MKMKNEPIVGSGTEPKRQTNKNKNATHNNDVLSNGGVFKRSPCILKGRLPAGRVGRGTRGFADHEAVLEKFEEDEDDFWEKI